MGLSVSKVLGGTLQAVKTRIGGLLGLWAAYFGIQILLMVFLVTIMGASTFASIAEGAGGEAGVQAMGVGMIVALILVYILYFVISFAQSASLCHMASPLLAPDFGASFKHGLRKAPTLIGVLLLLMVAYLLGAIVFGLFAAALANLGSAASVVLMVLLVPALVYLGCRIALFVPVAVVENVGNPVTVLRRSWSLTSGHVFKILLVFLCFGLVFGVLFLVALAPILSSIQSLQANGGMPNFGGIAFAGFAVLILGVLASICSAALQSVVHAELSSETGQNLANTFE